MKKPLVIFMSMAAMVGTALSLALYISGQKNDSGKIGWSGLSTAARKMFGGKKDENKKSTLSFMLSAPRVIALTGTPLPNSRRSDEYWSFMDTLEPVKEGFSVTLEPAGEQLVFMGDLLVKNSPTARYFSGGKYKSGRPELWPSGRIPYMVDSSITVKAELKEALLELKEQTGIEFVVKGREKDYVVFRAHKTHCLSTVGKIGGEQEVFLGPQCKKGEILHELMHTLGFFHEQSRPDRDDYILVFWENIDKKFWEQFKKVPGSAQNLVDVEFDFSSVMLYPPEAFALNPQYASMAKINGDLYVSNRENLSPLDIEKIVFLYHDELKQK